MSGVYYDVVNVQLVLYTFIKENFGDVPLLAGRPGTVHYSCTKNLGDVAELAYARA